MAIGIIIGTAFQNVVKSLVDDIITPPFGLIFDGVDFSNLTIQMTNFIHRNQPTVIIRYGLFLQQIIHLLVMAFALFALVKLLNRLIQSSLANRLRAESEEATAASPSHESHPQTTIHAEPDEQVKILCDIRDLLAAHLQSNSSRTTTSPSANNLITL